MVHLPLLTAFLTGALHALEPDHMAAVTTFVARRPTPREALGFGVRWALGHSASLLVATVILLLLDVRPSEGLGRLLEAAVGLLLVWLGLRLLRVQEAPPEVEPDRRGTAWVGAAHGLAGTGAFLALVPVTLLESRAMSLAYVVMFGVGTVIGMGAWGLVSGLLMERIPRRPAAVVTGLASAGIGLLWVGRALGL